MCKKPHTSTHIHYTSDLRLFFAWATESLITLRGLISLKESVSSAVFSASVLQPHDSTMPS